MHSIDELTLERMIAKVSNRISFLMKLNLLCFFLVSVLSYLCKIEEEEGLCEKQIIICIQSAVCMHQEVMKNM